jgi:hypothetical protein
LLDGLVFKKVKGAWDAPYKIDDRTKNDADFSTRWRLIKSYFSRKCRAFYQGKMTLSRQQKREKAI